MKLSLALLLAATVCAAQTAPPQAAPPPGRGPAGQGRGPAVRYRSKITVYDLRTKTSKVIYTADTRFEAPNWTLDGKYLLVNSAGTLWKLPADAPAPVTPEKLGLDAMYSCNNDHGLSFDGKMLAFSGGSPSARSSQVYLATADGKNPKQLTSIGVNYFHGFSPDGKWLSFIGQRPVSGVTKTEIYRVSADGAKEEKLTDTGGYDDGTDYSPDGKWIYFNSNRLGTTNDGWDIWRMPPDGAGPKDAKAERVTHDKWEDWFPHVSPDGKLIVFLSFPPGTENHNGQTDVEMRMISAPGKKTNPESVKIQTLLKFFGGQGTINVNSWSPDSKRFAFVVYEAIPPAAAPAPGRN
jgi:Periplasmic component of the Tol biopolymer transport system